VAPGVAGDAGFVAELGDGEQHHVVVAVHADVVHLLEVAGLLALVPQALARRLQYTAWPRSAVAARASRFIQANISTSPLPCSWAMTGTRPSRSHLMLSSQSMPAV
jgi:hypothetical protein